MSIDTKTIIIVVIISVFIITSILVVEFVLANAFGVNVSQLPMGVKTFLHLIGIGLIAFIIKKVFVH